MDAKRAVAVSAHRKPVFDFLSRAGSGPVPTLLNRIFLRRFLQ